MNTSKRICASFKILSITTTTKNMADKIAKTANSNKIVLNLGPMCIHELDQAVKAICKRVKVRSPPSPFLRSSMCVSIDPKKVPLNWNAMNFFVAVRFVLFSCSLSSIWLDTLSWLLTLPCLMASIIYNSLHMIPKPKITKVGCVTKSELVTWITLLIMCFETKFEIIWKNKFYKGVYRLSNTRFWLRCWFSHHLFLGEQSRKPS